MWIISKYIYKQTVNLSISNHKNKFITDFLPIVSFLVFRQILRFLILGERKSQTFRDTKFCLGKENHKIKLKHYTPGSFYMLSNDVLNSFRLVYKTATRSHHREM